MKRPIMLLLFFSFLKFNIVYSLESYDVFVSSLTPESELRNGSKGEGIYLFDLTENKDGTITFTRTNTVLNVSSAINTAITHSGKYMYASTFSDSLAESQIHAFRISNHANDRPATIGSWPVGETEAIHLSIDAEDRFLFVAMFDGNAATAFRIDADTGGLYMKNFFRFPNPNNVTRDAGSHSSVVDKKLRFVYFGSLHQDCIWRFDYSYATGFDIASLKIFQAPAGAGVRTMILHPLNETYLYVTCERTNHILVYKIDVNGDLHQIQYEPIPTANSTLGTRTADIRASSDGRFIYVSSRYGPNTIAAFEIRDDGTVKLIQEISSGGKVPNCFALISDINLMLVSNQNSDGITAFRTNPENGTLTRINQWDVNAPECFQVIPRAAAPQPLRGHLVLIWLIVVVTIFCR